MKWLLPVLLAAAAPLAGQSGCTYSVNTGSFLFNGSSNLSGSITVTTSGGTVCDWTPTTSATWIHFTSYEYTTTATFTFTVDANNGSTLLQNQILIQIPGTNGLTIPVIELTAACVYALSPASPLEIPVGGSTGTLQVSTGCTWTAGTTQSWLTGTPDSGNLLSGSTSFGSGKFDYTVAANSCVAARTASIVVPPGVVGSSTFVVNQDGSSANLTLSQTSLTTSSTATTGKLIVNTGLTCSWSGVTDSSWLQITASTGTGQGTISYSILANTGPTRTGHITVGPATFTVTQQAAPPPPITITGIFNGASYTSGSIAPGEIVSIFGSNMGPATGVPYQLSADGKSILSTLAGVQVLFGTLPAPLLYVSAAQINAVVPYGVTIGGNVTLQVQYQQQNATLSVPVAAASPGIFSQDYTGHGPGAILNQDNSLNSTFSPATAGSIIQIFATGGGAVSPTIADGFLAPSAEPLPRLTSVPVSVTIGGIPSPQIVYAGDAPGEIAGLMQINAVVPAGVTPGTAVPVVVTIGAAQSQSTLTITVQ